MWNKLGKETVDKLLTISESMDMAQWVGCAVSVNCGEPLGCYQGTILDANGATVTLTKAFRNGFPYPKSQVTLNAADIKDLKIIEPRSECNEQTHSTVAVSKHKKGQRATVCESLQNNPSGAEGVSGSSSAARGRSGESAPRTPKVAVGTGGGGGGAARGRERARRRDEACFVVDEGALAVDFDFEKNLALFDKRALWEELRHSHKPDVVRQTECGATGARGKLRHDENVLAAEPPALATHAIRLADGARGPLDYVTDEGVVVPSISGGARRALWAALARRGLAEGSLLLLARAAADLALRLVGGGRRLDPRNTHQLPCVVVLPGPHREGACGVTVARLLASHGVRTAVLAPVAGDCVEVRRALAAYALTDQPCVRRVADLPTPDLVVLALASPDRAEEPAEEAAEWARATRAALLAVEPPAAGTAGLSARACVVGGLPLAHAPANGLVHLADVAVPSAVLHDLTLAYRPPFGAASLLALHPSDAH